MPEEPKPPATCPLCGKKVDYFAIPLKDGKVWKFYGCTDRVNCRWVWKPPSKAELRHQEVMKALRTIYAKIQELENKLCQEKKEKGSKPTSKEEG